jgi:hypothetical protein
VVANKMDLPKRENLTALRRRYPDREVVPVRRKSRKGSKISNMRWTFGCVNGLGQDDSAVSSYVETVGRQKRIELDNRSECVKSSDFLAQLQGSSPFIMSKLVVASYCTTFLKSEMLHIYRQVTGYGMCRPSS